MNVQAIGTNRSGCAWTSNPTVEWRSRRSEEFDAAVEFTE